jgi:hypothetical protein
VQARSKKESKNKALALRGGKASKAGSEVAAAESAKKKWVAFIAHS